MYKQDLELNNSQGLICHKTQPNQITILPIARGRTYVFMQSEILTAST